MNSEPYSHEFDFEKGDQWRRALDLAYASWRVAERAIEDGFLRDKVKNFAADMLAAYPGALAGLPAAQREFREKARAQCALLSLAQKVSDAHEINFLILKNEYAYLAGSFPERERPPERLDDSSRAGPSAVTARTPEVSLPVSGRSVPEPKKHEEPRPAETFFRPERPQKNRMHSEDAPALSERQQKIIQFFNKRKDEKIKLRDVVQFFPDLTDRTIRNDLRDLCVKKLVKRSEGHGQGSYYLLAKE
ncbi:MAG: hypothetical protein AAB581_00095 [Patescibacteria group bacterium]